MCEAIDKIEEKSRQEGRQESMIEIAKRMLEDGMLPLEKIAEYSKLSMDEVLSLKVNKTI